MFNIELKPNTFKINELSVRLEVNMTNYCILCAQLHDAEKTLRQNYQATNPQNDLPYDLYQRQQNAYVMQHLNPLSQKKLHDERLEISDQLFAIVGATYWSEAKQILNQLCNLTDENEQILAKALTAIDHTPPVIHLLNNHFIELFKNSMDAIILQYLQNKSRNTTLQIDISISKPISPTHLNLILLDNAGGFPDDYPKIFNDFVEQEKYRDKRVHHKISEKSQGNLLGKYCFGGEGIGMFACVKEMLLNHENSFMQIQNARHSSGQIGAEITFSSSLLPSTTHQNSDIDDSWDSVSAISPQLQTSSSCLLPISQPYSHQSNFFSRHSSPVEASTNETQNRRPSPLSPISMTLNA